jgi:outer membrane protein TolC
MTPARAAEKLSVDDAVRLALANHPELRSVSARANASSDQARSARGRLGATVQVYDHYQHWDDAFSINPGAIGFPAAASSSSRQLVARDRDTNTLTVSASQPLVGLLHLSHEWSAARASAAAAKASVDVAAADLRQIVRSDYLRYFEALAVEKIAAASEGELIDQVRLAESRVAAGVLIRAELMRVQVALADARQQRITAHASADVARAELLRAIGLPADAALELEEPHQLLHVAAAPLPARNEAVGAALRRPEIKRAQLTLRSAKADARARSLSLLPEVDLDGAYQRNDGMALSGPTNSWYVGVKAQWAIWQWGTVWYSARAARHLKDAAALDLDDQRQQVQLEAHSRVIETAAAGAAVEVATQAIASAEEAYRVTARSVDTGSATTTDLIVAQSSLTTARLNLARAEYVRALERVALSRAMAE